MTPTAFAKFPLRLHREPLTGEGGWRALCRRLADRVIGVCSAVPDDAVLDVRLFPWTAELRANWATIRHEALACRSIATPWTHGEWVEIDAAHAPSTAATVARVPGAVTAGFSFLSAGAHLAQRRGGTKALVTCQLGLCVPREGDARMRIDGRIVRWAEGETLVFDETALHEVWNDTTEARVVLVVRFRRPLRGLAGLLARRPWSRGATSP